MTDLLPPRAALLTRLQASARQVPIMTTLCDCVWMCDGVWAGVPIARLLILAGADIGKKNNVSVAIACGCVCVTPSRCPSLPLRYYFSSVSLLFSPMTPLQEGLTCCDEARADGRNDFVMFIRAVQHDVDSATQRGRGDARMIRSLVEDAFGKFDAVRKAPAEIPQAAPPAADGGRKFKFSSSRATLRVKTTVELWLEEQREAAAAGGGAGGGAAPAPKPKSRIMFSS